MEKLDNSRVILAIQENIYMQYFVGLKEFTVDPVFDPSCRNKFTLVGQYMIARLKIGGKRNAHPFHINA